jgi:ribonucleoside-diphosphate reductase alpha chain
VRGAVLQTKDEKAAEKPVAALIAAVEPRPDELQGRTYKVRFPTIEEAFYVTINDVVTDDGVHRPFEIFINSKSVKHAEWIAALTRTISAIFRRGGDTAFIVDELKQVHSAQAGAFIKGKYVPSLPALIGYVIEKHFKNIGLIPTEQESQFPVPEEQVKMTDVSTEKQGALGDICPSCQNPTLIYQEGCAKCPCGYSQCG